MAAFAYSASVRRRALAHVTALLTILVLVPLHVKAETNPALVTIAPGKGFTVTAPDNTAQANVKARIQVRETFKDDGKNKTFDTAVKTARLTTSGYVLAPELKYYLQLAFGPGDLDKDGPSPILDAYVEYVGLRDLNVRVGQYYVPFDRARTTRESALQFVDRQQVVKDLTLDRDVGLMLSSSDLFGLGGVLGYHLYVGSGDGKNRLGDQKFGPLAVLRLVAKPWGNFDDDQEGDLTREARPRLAIGVAGAYDYQTTRQSSTFGTVLTGGTLNTLHAAADLVFKYAGFSFFAEGVYRHANKAKLDSLDKEGKPVVDKDGNAVPEWARSGFGFFAQAGYLVHPKVEVVARWDQSFADDATDPKFLDGKQAGGGVNVYLNGHALKIQADYFYLFGQSTPNGSHVARLALDATF